MILYYPASLQVHITVCPQPSFTATTATELLVVGVSVCAPPPPPPGPAARSPAVSAGSAPADARQRGGVGRERGDTAGGEQHGQGAGSCTVSGCVEWSGVEWSGGECIHVYVCVYVRTLLACSGNEALAGTPAAPQTPSAPTQQCPTTSAHDTRTQPVALSTASSDHSGRLGPPSQTTRHGAPCGGVLPPQPPSLGHSRGDQCPQPPVSGTGASPFDNDDFDNIDFEEFDDFDQLEEASRDSAALQPHTSTQSPLSCPPSVDAAPIAGTAPSPPSPAIIVNDQASHGPQSRPVCKVEPLQSTPKQTIVLDDSPPLARKPSPLDDRKKG